MTLFPWMGMVLCLFPSAMLSGLKLAFFAISKLELQIEVTKGNKQAHHVLVLRRDANFLLVMVLWANVAVNVLLAPAFGIGADRYHGVSVFHGCHHRFRGDLPPGLLFQARPEVRIPAVARSSLPSSRSEFSRSR